jgi:hypothetical protein
MLDSIIKLSAKIVKLKESKTQEENPETEDDSQVYYEIVPKENNRGNSIHDDLSFIFFLFYLFISTCSPRGLLILWDP